MLLSFSVSNFRSFYEEATLNMVASNKLTDHPNHRVPIGEDGVHVLRAGLIYGANASGKSNLVKAMSFAQRQIRGGNETGFNVQRFRFNPNASAEPSSFEYRFFVKDRVFVYGFDLLTDAVIKEWLFILEGDIEVDVFERDREGEVTVGKSSEAFKDDQDGWDTLNVLSKIPVRKNQLFLNRVLDIPAESRGEILHYAIWWLTECLTVLNPDHRFLEILDKLHSETDFKSFAAQFMANVGTGIDGLEITETERSADEVSSSYLANIARRSERGLRPMVRGSGDVDVRLKEDQPSTLVERRLLTQHFGSEGETYELPFADESDGTKQLLHLMPVLYSLNSECKVVVIDELDRSLHPKLCWEFIRFFSESCPGACKQLIVTTHEAHLLNQELLRRDEYWFVEKDTKQQSHLVSLSEFSIRNDLQLQKGYLQGRFGAIPVIGSTNELQRLLDCPAKEDS